MNFRNLVIFLSLAIPLVGYSSDNIHLNSGQIIECKVLSIDPTTVTVEILKNGIKRTFYKTEIKAIVYEDGTAEVFTGAKSEPTGEMKQPVSGWDGERKGFILGFGVGVGVINYTQERSSFAGNSVSVSKSSFPFVSNIKIGYGFTNHVILNGSAIFSWIELSPQASYFSSKFTAAGIVNVALSYFFKPRAPSIFMSGGIGISGWLRLLEKSYNTWNGKGIFLGVGYETSKHNSIEAGFKYGNPSSDEDYNTNTTFTTFFITVNVLGY